MVNKQIEFLRNKSKSSLVSQLRRTGLYHLANTHTNRQQLFIQNKHTIKDDTFPICRLFLISKHASAHETVTFGNAADSFEIKRDKQTTVLFALP